LTGGFGRPVLISNCSESNGRIELELRAIRELYPNNTVQVEVEKGESCPNQYDDRMVPAPAHRGSVQAYSFSIRRGTAICSSACACHCHVRKTAPLSLSLPPFLRDVCGTLYMGYTGYPTSPPQCNYPQCLQRDQIRLELKYLFPGWFVQTALNIVLSRSLSSGFKFSLNMRHRVQSAPGDIFSCARTGNANLLRQRLQENPAQVNYVNWQDGRVALHDAIYHGQVDAMRVLLDAGADTSIEDDRGADSISKAVTYICSGHFAPEVSRAMEGLLKVSDFDDELEFSTLHKVVLGRGSTDLASYLRSPSLDARSLLEQLQGRDKMTRTPLHWAAARDDVNAVRQLLHAGAEVDACTAHKRTPLSFLATSRTMNCFDVLLEYGADIHAVEMSGCSIFHLAARWGSLQLVIKLKEAGVDVNVRVQNKVGATALLYAANANHVDIVEYLLEQGADIEAACHTGSTALLYAVSENAHGCLELLLDAGADYQHENQLGENILHRAARAADVGTLEILAGRNLTGLDSSLPNFANETPVEIHEEYGSKSQAVKKAFDDLIAAVCDADSLREG
jgi:ankyrin repeat protein